MPRQQLIQLRRDTAANWTSVDPILGLAEAGLETDTNKLKFGDGVTAWNSLPYFVGSLQDIDSVLTEGAVATIKPTFEGNIKVGNIASNILEFNTTVPFESFIVVADGTSMTIQNTNQIALTAGGTGILLDSDGLTFDDGTTPTIGQVLAAVDTAGNVAWTTPSGGGSGVVETIVAGANVTVDATDPANPIVASTGGYTAPTYIANIEDYGAIADNGTTNCTAAFISARDALVALGGGNLVIPNRGADRFYITTGVTNSLADFSNITITGGGKVFIEELAGGATNSRGVLIRLANGTDNFKMYDIDILVSALAVTDVGYTHGVICQEQVNSCAISNIIIENVKIHSEVRLDSALGNHGITFTRNDADFNSTATNITVRDCDIKLYGNSIYGVHFKTAGKGVSILNNHLELTANTAAPDEAYNTLAIYGDSEDVNILGNYVYGGGHSPIAVSTAGRAVITNNFVYDIAVTGEAGIEFEYKGGHGTIGYQPENCIISNNQVYNAYIGILIADRLNDATSKSPIGVVVCNNFIKDSILSDIEVTSSFTAAGNDTTRITNVILDGNIISSSATEAHIRSRDGSNLKIINNIMSGGANMGIKLGRNSTIKVRGEITLTNNTIKETVSNCVQIETADDIQFSMTNNKLYGGFRGFFSNSDINVGGESSMQFIGNYFDGMSGDGLFISNSNVEGIIINGNIAVNCGDRGFQLTADYLIYTTQFTRNCVNGPSVSGTGIITQDFINR